MTVVLFFVVVLTVLVGGTMYVGRRLAEGGGPWARRVSWALVLTNTALMVTAFGVLRRDSLGTGWQVPLQWTAMVGLGLFALLMAFFLTIDGMRLGLTVLTRLRGKERVTDASRRGFLLRPIRLTAAATAGVVATVGYREAQRLATVVEVEIPIPDLPDALVGYRIAQISDLHVGPTIRGDYVRGVVDRTNALGADLIAVTGDLVDGTVDAIQQDVAPIGDLAAVDGVYFVTGNHEYYAGVDRWLAEVERLGITPLVNSHRIIERGGARLLLAGVTDHRAHMHHPEHRSDPAGAVKGAPPCQARVLLAHQPRSAYGAAELGAFDLQLSGHTHGGQFLPFSWFVHLFQPFAVGLHRHQGMWIYTNRGTGYWGPPNRAGVPAEITHLTLRRARA